MGSIVEAGEELNFGEAGKSVRLETRSNSIRCEIYGENNQLKRYVATRSGFLHSESMGQNLLTGAKSESRMKKDKMQIDILPFNANRYYPQEGDTIIGTIVSKNFEFYLVDIGAESYAVLNCQEFQNATRKEKPNYQDGTLIYCRVLSAEKFGKVQLSCINPLDKKAWNSGDAFFQDLKDGFIRDFPIVFCRKQLLTQKEDYLLENLGSIIAFEMCVGYNGKVWVKAEKIEHTIFIINALQKIVDIVSEKFEEGNYLIYQDQEVRDQVDIIVQSLQKKPKGKKKV